jgi:hypothetical protein
MAILEFIDFEWPSNVAQPNGWGPSYYETNNTTQHQVAYQNNSSKSAGYESRVGQRYDTLEELYADFPSYTPEDPGVDQRGSVPTSWSIDIWVTSGIARSRPRDFVAGNGLFRSSVSANAAFSLNETWNKSYEDKYWTVETNPTSISYIESIDSGSNTGDPEEDGGGVATFSGWGFSGWIAGYEDYYEVESGGWSCGYTYTPWKWIRTYTSFIKSKKRVFISHTAAAGTLYFAGWTSTQQGGDITNSGLEFYPVKIGTEVNRWIENRPPIEIDGNVYNDGEDDEYGDFFWNPDEYPGDPGAGGWTLNPWDLTTLGGGSYKKHLTVVGHKKIYFREV